MKIKTVTKVSLINGAVLALLTLAEFSGWIKFPLLLSYEWHKILHITGVVLFMGNMIAGPVWFSYAYYSKNTEIIKFGGRLMEITDLALTIPGMILTIINGLFLASVFGGSGNLPWLYYSIILLLTMWILSIPLIYIQEKLYSYIEHQPENRRVINRWLAVWSIVGSIVMIPPSIIFYWMVVKGV